MTTGLNICTTCGGLIPPRGVFTWSGKICECYCQQKIKAYSANELADELEQTPFESTRFEAATMLREQQEQIESLQLTIDNLYTAFELSCDSVQSIIELSKAQYERYWSEKK